MNGPGSRVRSEEEIRVLSTERRGLWPAIRWIRRRRPFLTALLVLAAPGHALAARITPLDLLTPSPDPRFVLAWVLVGFGVFIRLWGSGNLRKNHEITDAGVYRLVRHPLYLGSLSFLLAYFITVGDPLVGILLFLALVALVYYPTMLSEEEYLSFKFPDQFADYRPPPRLLPDPRRITESLRSDRFSPRAAYWNLGFRSVWFIIALPLFLRLFAWLQVKLT